ncbi:hypothetical protein VPH35_082341 [Triticum aestivum]
MVNRLFFYTFTSSLKVSAGWTTIAMGPANQLLFSVTKACAYRPEMRRGLKISASTSSLSLPPFLCAASSPPDPLLFVVRGGWRSSSRRRSSPPPLPPPQSPPPLPPPQSATSSPIRHRRAQEEPSIWGGHTRTGDCRDGDQGRGFGGCAHVEQRRTGEGHDSSGVPAGEREDEGDRSKEGRDKERTEEREVQRREKNTGRRRRSAASLGCRWSCFSVSGRGESHGGLVAAHSRPLCHKRSTHHWIKVRHKQLPSSPYLAL